MATGADEALTRRGLPLDPDLRILALGAFANRFGGGAVMTTSALYFTRHVGFTAGQVALALSVSAVVGLLVQVPAGHLGDTRGPREVLALALAGSALFATPPAFARTPWQLALLLGALAFFERAAGAVNQGVVAQLARGGRGVLFKAYLRSVTNTAIAVGSLVGGAALLVDEAWAYVAVFVANAVLTAFAAWNTTRLPHLPAYTRSAGEPRLAVLRDWPYVVITAMTGLFALHFIVMELGIALYISQRTEAPTVMVAVLLLLNTVAVALFQVRLSRGSDAVASSAHSLLRGSLWIAAGFAVIGLATRLPAAAAIAVLVVGSLLHVVGEMIGSGGQWGLQMGLSPHERQGQYQGFAGLGFTMVTIVGPPVVTLLCVRHSDVGWLVLAGVMVLISGSTIPLARWALAHRAPYGVTTHSG
ncbi:MAG: MFS transporter [Nocardioidaceae bacterium]